MECPHCGFKQMEYVAAKTTICRQCGRSFSPMAPKPVAKVADESAPAAEVPLHRKIENIWSRQRKRLVIRTDVPLVTLMADDLHSAVSAVSRELLRRPMSGAALEVLHDVLHGLGVGRDPLVVDAGEDGPILAGDVNAGFARDRDER